MSAHADVEVKRCPRCRNAIGKAARICPVCGCSVASAAVMRVARWCVLAMMAGAAVWWWARR